MFTRFFSLLESRFFLFSFFFGERWVGFFSLVDKPEHKKEFKRRYKIPSRVNIKHCQLEEWHERRPAEVVVIPMIAFIKGEDEDSYG